jgi:diguanylate cyclase (GGDEF)-like protein
MAMDRTPRVGLVVAASVVVCALATILIGGLGISGVGSASRSGERLANDELAKANLTARIAHEVDIVLADSVGSVRGDAGPRAPSVYDVELPAIEAQLNDLQRLHEGDPAGERANVTRLVDQWARFRSVVNERRTAAAPPGYVAGLRHAYGPLARHLQALEDREANNAADEFDSTQANVGRIKADIVAAIVVAVLASLGLGLLLLRLVRRAIEPARDQVEFADTLQLAEHEAEAHLLLQRHLERLVTDTSVTILNRNNSSDRLEAVTDIGTDSALVLGLAHASHRSRLAVRSARVHDQDERRPPLLGCSVCGGCPGTSTCAPLTLAGEVIGSVLVNRPDRYNQSERNQIRDAVAQSAPVLANLRNLAIAELRASTDSLTGLPNKRAVADTLQRMVAQSSRSLSPLSLLVLDLDHFKTINDRLGHPVGDQVLANVGAALRSTLRDGDFAGRNGGEEFILLLPDTDLVGALTAAEKVRVAVEEIDIPGLEVSTTASIGIAVYPEHAVNPERLERLADAALYVAKKSGRNRVEVASPASDSGRADLDDEPRWPQAVT